MEIIMKQHTNAILYNACIGNINYNKYVRRMISEINYINNTYKDDENLNNNSLNYDNIKPIIESIFSENIFSWGRIVSCFTFISNMYKIGIIPNNKLCEIVDYVGNLLNNWLLQNGGWKYFEDITSNY